jgi:hypothetical protein
VNFTDHRTYASVLRLNFKILRSIFAGLCFTPFFFEIYRFSWYYILQERCPFPASSGHTGTVLPLSKPTRHAVAFARARSAERRRQTRRRTLARQPAEENMNNMGYYTAIIIITVFAMFVMIMSAYSNSFLPKDRQRGFIVTFFLVILAALSEWLGVYLDGAPEAMRSIHIAVKMYRVLAHARYTDNVRLGHMLLQRRQARDNTYRYKRIL